MYLLLSYIRYSLPFTNLGAYEYTTFQIFSTFSIKNGLHSVTYNLYAMIWVVHTYIHTYIHSAVCDFLRVGGGAVQDGGSVLRFISNQKRRAVVCRDMHPHLLAESTQFIPSKENEVLTTTVCECCCTFLQRCLAHYSQWQLVEPLAPMIYFRSNCAFSCKLFKRTLNGSCLEP